MKIGFVGLGNVGGKLAGSLLRNNFDVTVRDIDESLTNLFKKLFEKDIYFLLSSNAHPTNLYLDGLQRQKFVSAINLMEKHLNIYKLDGDRDYRISLISQFEKSCELTLIKYSIKSLNFIFCILVTQNICCCICLFGYYLLFHLV